MGPIKLNVWNKDANIGLSFLSHALYGRGYTFNSELASCHWCSRYERNLFSETLACLVCAWWASVTIDLKVLGSSGTSWLKVRDCPKSSSQVVLRIYISPVKFLTWQNWKHIKIFVEQYFHFLFCLLATVLHPCINNLRLLSVNSKSSLIVQKLSFISSDSRAFPYMGSWWFDTTSKSGSIILNTFLFCVVLLAPLGLLLFVACFRMCFFIFLFCLFIF